MKIFLEKEGGRDNHWEKRNVVSLEKFGFTEKVLQIKFRITFMFLFLTKTALVLF